METSRKLWFWVQCGPYGSHGLQDPQGTSIEDNIGLKFANYVLLTLTKQGGSSSRSGISNKLASSGIPTCAALQKPRSPHKDPDHRAAKLVAKWACLQPLHWLQERISTTKWEDSATYLWTRKSVGTSGTNVLLTCPVAWCSHRRAESIGINSRLWLSSSSQMPPSQVRRFLRK